MRIVANGEAVEVPSNVRSLDSYLAHAGLSGKRLAVERNGEIVPRSRYAETELSDGDRLEIVVAVGGG
jgi:sulfur carrier protein